MTHRHAVRVCAVGIVICTLLWSCRSAENPVFIKEKARDLSADPLAQQYLTPGVPIPESQSVYARPQPYSEEAFGPLRAGDLTEDRSHDPAWTAPEARLHAPALSRQGLNASLPSNPPGPCSNCNHESKGWEIRQGRGVYARVDVQRNFTIKTGDVSVSVYAPTHYPSGAACLEATVMHYRTTGNPSGATSNFFGFWDWCERSDQGGWGYAGDMDATGFRNKYVRLMPHADGDPVQEEAAFVQVYALNPSATTGSYDCWRGLLWNFSVGVWDLLITRCGPNPSHIYYPGPIGWSIWEDYNVSYYGCTDYDHPGISAESVQYLNASGVWRPVSDAGVKFPEYYSDPSATCFASGVYDIHEHLVDMWHGHTYANRQ